jgi:AmmeMemoRadiSam system protein B
MVGSLSRSSESSYGELLAPLLEDRTNFWAVSSDFCHWGDRFSYTYYDNSKGAIWKSIEQLDRMGMDAIESRQLDRWYGYMKQYKNTICGSHPIGVYLQMLDHAPKQTAVANATIKFVYYAQSNRCTLSSHSSVSYAPAVVSIGGNNNGSNSSSSSKV